VILSIAALPANTPAHDSVSGQLADTAGLITCATDTGKNVTLQMQTEPFSLPGVPGRKSRLPRETPAIETFPLPPPAPMMAA